MGGQNCADESGLETPHETMARIDEINCLRADVKRLTTERGVAREIAASRLDSILHVGDEDGGCLCDYFNGACPYCLVTTARDEIRADTIQECIDAYPDAEDTLLAFPGAPKKML